MAFYLYRNKDSFVKQTTRILSAFFMAFLLFSCASSPQAGLSHSPRPADCWLLQPVIYRMRQSARLEYQGKKEMLEGFMELDLNRDRAHLVIFNSLGLTLLNIEVEHHRYQLIEVATRSGDKLEPNRRKQQFAAAVATAVQNIFFKLKSCQKNHHTEYQQPYAEFSESPPRLTKISDNRHKPTWIVTYHDYGKGPAGRLPGRIILQNHKPDYHLTLWLHKAELSTRASR